MSSAFERIGKLVAKGEVRISSHGYDELADDDILAGDVLDGVASAVVVEDYPKYPKGPCALVLETDGQGQPIHAVWGIPRGKTSPAVLVMAYRPDPGRWSEDFKRRKQ